MLLATRHYLCGTSARSESLPRSWLRCSRAMRRSASLHDGPRQGRRRRGDANRPTVVISPVAALCPARPRRRRAGQSLSVTAAELLDARGGCNPDQREPGEGGAIRAAGRTDGEPQTDLCTVVAHCRRISHDVPRGVGVRVRADENNRAVAMTRWSSTGSAARSRAVGGVREGGESRVPEEREGSREAGDGFNPAITG